MRNHKTICIRIVAFFIIFLLALSFVKHITSNYILDAAVNDDTGMISFLNRDYEVKTYDQFGNLMYEFKLSNNAGGYALLDYKEGRLIVETLRTNEIQIYDENGVIISSCLIDYEPKYYWDDWNRDSISYYYETSTHIYRYTYPTYWRFLFSKEKITLKIMAKDNQTETVLWNET